MHWSWAGLVAVILALSLGAGWLLVVTAMVWGHAPARPETVYGVASIGHTIAGGLASYLGVRTALQHRHRDDDTL